MASTNHAVSAGPADSQLVRTLFYIGEGAMLGGVGYYAINLVFLVFADPWFVAIIVLWLVFVVGRSVAVISANRASQPPIYHEWIAVRRWRWVGIVGVAVTGLLVGVTVLRWGWQGWSVSEATALGFGTVMLGFVLRWGVQDILSREPDTGTTT